MKDQQRIAIESGSSVEWISEKNYRFRLCDYIPQVRKWLSGSPITPASRAKDLQAFLDVIEGENRHLSVSRRKSVARWGIPVPGDDEQLIYVWLDALVNYLSVPSGAMIHIVGKDILK